MNSAHGQLGNGTGGNGWGDHNDDSLVPLRIGDRYDWAMVAANHGYTIAARTDGTLWAWGYNNQGQLGDGSTEPRLAPVRIGWQEPERPTVLK